MWLSRFEGASGLTEIRPTDVAGSGDHPWASPNMCSTLLIPQILVHFITQIKLTGPPSLSALRLIITPVLTILTEVETKALRLRNWNFLVGKRSQTRDSVSYIRGLYSLFNCYSESKSNWTTSEGGAQRRKHTLLPQIPGLDPCSNLPPKTCPDGPNLCNAVPWLSGRGL